MSFIEKVAEKDIMLFARKNLIGKYKELNTLCMQSERVKSGWFVEHRFEDEAGFVAKEGYFFVDFAINYVAGQSQDATPSREYWQSIQQVYRDFMTEQFGTEYTEVLDRNKAKAEAIMANYTARKQEQARIQSVVNGLICADNLGKAEESQKSDEISQERE